MPTVGEVGRVVRVGDVYDAIAREMGTLGAAHIGLGLTTGWTADGLAVGWGETVMMGHDLVLVLAMRQGKNLVLGPHGGVGYHTLGPRIGFEPVTI